MLHVGQHGRAEARSGCRTPPSWPRRTRALDRLGGPGQWLLGAAGDGRRRAAGAGAVDPRRHRARVPRRAPRPRGGRGRDGRRAPVRLARAHAAVPAGRVGPGRRAGRPSTRCCSAERPRPRAVLELAAEAGVRIVRTYGMTETCGGCVYDGVPLDGVRLRIEDDGQGRDRRGPVAAPRAWGSGWSRATSAGSTTTGRLTVLGRADQVAVSGGVNVPLAAVESALRDEPGVLDVAVVAQPDPEWGQRVVAFVVRRPRSRLAPAGRARARRPPPHLDPARRPRPRRPAAAAERQARPPARWRVAVSPVKCVSCH